MKFNRHSKLAQRSVLAISTITLAGTISLSGVAAAARINTTAASSSTGTSASASANQQAHLQNIISRGNAEINRRLTTLDSLTSKINAATHLTAGDKSVLSNEVGSTISGLNSLKTQLDSATTVSAAGSDASDIFTEYRVYALVAPKVDLIKVADDQQTVQGQLSSLAQQLQSRITAEQQAGQNVTSLQSELADMNSKLSAGQSISSNIESVVINLQPSDYNSNHAILSGDNNQLKTAHTDDQAAYTDAKNIVASLNAMS